ncbi:hypothetical protein Plec18170_002707 [Paecilomyces lecythidis]
MVFDIDEMRADVEVLLLDMEEQQSDTKQLQLEMEDIKKMQLDFEWLNLSNESYMREMYSNRAAVLDVWSSQEKSSAFSDRNISGRDITAHRGTVAMDVATIKECSKYSGTDERRQKWKTAFDRCYGIRYSDIADRVKKVHPYFRTVLDFRAGALKLGKWQARENTEKKERIIENADRIIYEWYENGDDIFQEDSAAMGYYHEIMNDWYSV